MRRLIHALLLVVILFTACDPNGRFDREYLKDDCVSLKVEGDEVFRFDAPTCQTAYNMSDNEYRIFKDDMSEYFIIRLGSLPKSKGQKIKACSLKWTSLDDICFADNLDFRVENLESDGKVWLWESTRKIVVILQLP